MLFDKLRQIEERSHEVARLLSDPAIFGQPAEYARLRKEHADTVDIVERFTAYREVRTEATEGGVTLREAAFTLAVERVARAIRLRGFV